MCVNGKLESGICKCFVGFVGKDCSIRDITEQFWLFASVTILIVLAVLGAVMAVYSSFPSKEQTQFVPGSTSRPHQD